MFGFWENVVALRVHLPFRFVSAAHRSQGKPWNGEFQFPETLDTSITGQTIRTVISAAKASIPSKQFIEHHKQVIHQLPDMGNPTGQQAKVKTWVVHVGIKDNIIVKSCIIAGLILVRLCAAFSSQLAYGG